MSYEVSPGGFAARLGRHPRILSGAIAGLAAIGLSMIAIVPGKATIGGSTFNAGDGNMSVESGDPHDWADTTLLANVPDSYKGNILAGLPGDDAFANGAKEDDNPASVGYGGVPPNKDDFTRMYLATQHRSTSSSETDYLYMAWLRTDNPGTAFEAFEFNQSSTISSNGVTPVRTAGDVLVLYDLDQGGTIPTISVSRWITDNNTSSCDNVKHVAPCWATRVAQGSANEEASINGSSFTDPITGVFQDVRTFGEAALNLQGAGIFSTGCVHLGKASLTSRSSSSLDSTMKDLVGPVNVNITNCGTVNIHKQDDTASHNPLSGVVFTLYKDNSPTGGTRGAEDTVTTYTCTTNSSGDCSISSVPLGRYWVVEGTPPSGFNAAPDQNVTLGGGNPTTVSLTFTDNRQPASLKVHKQDDDNPANPLSGVVFTLYTDNSPKGGSRGAEDTATSFTCTTGSNGDCTISNILPAGDYWVVETTGKSGYAGAGDKHVTLALGQNADITSTPFVDPRNFKVIIIVCQESNGTLYPTPITIDGTSAGNSLSAAQLGSLSESGVCGITAGSAGGKQYGSHSATANIAQ